MGNMGIKMKVLGSFIIVFMLITTYSCATAPVALLSINEIQKFKSVKTIRLVYTEDFWEGEERQKLKLDRDAHNFFRECRKFDVVSADANQYDATIRIDGNGKALAAKYVTYDRNTGTKYGKPHKKYTGVKATLSATLEIDDGPSLTNTLDIRIKPPTSPPVYLWRPVHFGLSKLLHQTVGQAFGVDYLIAIMAGYDIQGNRCHPDFKSIHYALKRIGEPAEVPLIAFLMDESVEMKRKGWPIRIYRDIYGSRAIDTLLWLVRNKESVVAAGELGTLCDIDAVEPLIDIMMKFHDEGKKIDYLLRNIKRLTYGDNYKQCRLNYYNQTENLADIFKRGYPYNSQNPKEWKDWWDSLKDQSVIRKQKSKIKNRIIPKLFN